MGNFCRFGWILLLLSGLSAAGQNTVIIEGVVRDGADKSPMFGVAVINTAGEGVLTNDEGRFSIQARVPDTLLFRYVAHVPVKIAVDGPMKPLDIVLQEDGGLLSTVVVTGSKFEKEIGEETVSIEVIRSSLIDHANNVSIEQSVQKVPGVNVIDGQANIRGGTGYSYGAGSRVLLLMDDIPLLTADAALSNWNFVPVENIAQIEVIKGASSALYGSSALNGIINVRTAYPGSEPYTRITSFGGIYEGPSDKTQQWWSKEQPYFSGMSFAHRQKFGKFDLVAGGYGFVQDSYLEGDYDRFGRGNIQTRYRLNERLSFGVNGVLQINRSASFFFWADSAHLFSPAENTMTFNKGNRMSLDPFIHYRDPWGNQHKLQGRYYKSDNRNESDQSSLADLYYAEYQFQKKLEAVPVVVTAGATMNNGIVQAELYGDSSYVAANQALYLQADWSPGRLNLNGGFRWEHNHLDLLDESRPIFRFGASYRAADYTFIRASWGQGYRFPSIAEKFVSTSVSLFNIFPNPELESETGWSAELGLKQGLQISGWQAYVDASVFMQRYFNMMEFTFGYYPSPGVIFPYGFKSLNIGNTEIRGGEVSVSGAGKFGRFPLSVLAGYTYIDPVFQDFDSLTDANSTADYNILKYRFKHVVKFDAESSFEHFRPGIEVQYNSYMEAIDQVFLSFIAGLEEYRAANDHGEAVVNIRFAWIIDQHSEVSVLCNNLLNNMYTIRPAYMEPTRNWTLKYSYLF